jgi:RNA 2',3'-cyclic 3'-phosphodiesterase
MTVFDASDAKPAGELFLAILPDAETSGRIYRMAEILKTAHRFRARLTARERLHVTLFSLGGLPEQLVGKACEAIGGVKAEPFDISFDRTVSFRGRQGSRPFVLAGGDGVSGLKSFRRSLAAAFARNGLRYLARRDFTPHVTLLFDDRAVEEQPAGPIGWTVRNLVLIHSMKGHQHLARWPLHVG